jgi:trigger factor
MGDDELKIAVEEPRTWSRRLTITVAASRVARERDDIARKLTQRLKLPGFRKGRIPTRVLEKKYGPAIERETLESVVSDAYREALQRERLQPITQASIDAVDWQPGSDLTFQAEFEVRPEVELARLGGFRIEAPRATVTDAELDRVLEAIRADHATWHDVTDVTPTAGEQVTLEITPLTDADTGEPRRYQIVLGEGQAVADVEAAVQTLTPGGEGDFTIRLAEAGSDPGGDPGGAREQRVRIRLVEVKRPELPALDDELARAAGDFPDLASLRVRVREDMEREAAREVERETRRRLLEAVIEANPFELPAVMVDQYLESVLQPRVEGDEARLAELREATRPAAEQALKRLLVVDRIAKLEGLEATASEVEERMAGLAERMGRPVAEVKAQLRKGGRLAAVAEEITEDKVFAYLRSMSTIE